MDRCIGRSTTSAGLRTGSAVVTFLIAFGAAAFLTVSLAVTVRLIAKVTGDSRTPEQRAAEVTDQLLALIAAGNVEESYKWFSRDLRENTSQREWGNTVKEWKALGALQSKEQTEFKEWSSGSQHMTNVRYQAVFAKGPAKVSAQYRKTSDGRWLLDIFNIEKTGEQP